MAATESSVVVALKEVRRLELERQRREEEARRTAQHAAERESASVQYGPGIVPFGANGWSTEGLPEGLPRPVHRTSEVMPIATQHNFGVPQSYVGQTPPAWEGPGYMAPPVKKRSVVAPVLITALLCGAGAVAGFWKLDGDHKAQLSRIEAGRQRAEDQKSEAVAARAKAEQELKLKVTELEGKLTTAGARAAAASAALAQAAKAAPAAVPAAAPAPLPPAGARAGLRKARAAARAAAVAAKATPAPLPKAPAAAVAPVAPAPKVAKKKSLSDDPLGGLRL
jgi:hypothetical protein